MPPKVGWRMNNRPSAVDALPMSNRGGHTASQFIRLNDIAPARKCTNTYPRIDCRRTNYAEDTRPPRVAIAILCAFANRRSPKRHDARCEGPTDRTCEELSVGPPCRVSLMKRGRQSLAGLRMGARQGFCTRESSRESTRCTPRLSTAVRHRHSYAHRSSIDCITQGIRLLL